MLAGLILLVSAYAVSAFADSHDPWLEPTRWSVFIHTHAGDELRRNRIWIVGLGEHLYVRTGSTRWHDDIKLDPRVTVEAGDRREAFRVSRVLDPQEHAQVMRAFRAKYGWMDWLVYRMRDTTFRLAPIAANVHAK